MKRAQGVLLGRPPVLPGPVVARIVAEHRGGCSLASIARGLTADGTPTAHGGQRCHASAVRTVLARAEQAAAA